MGAGATLRALVINIGDGGAGDAGLDGLFDNVVVSTSAGETVYDFEPVPQTKADCAGAGWQDYGDQFKNQGQCVSWAARHTR